MPAPIIIHTDKDPSSIALQTHVKKHFRELLIWLRRKVSTMLGILDGKLAAQPSKTARCIGRAGYSLVGKIIQVEYSPFRPTIGVVSELASDRAFEVDFGAVVFLLKLPETRPLLCAHRLEAVGRALKNQHCDIPRRLRFSRRSVEPRQ